MDISWHIAGLGPIKKLQALAKSMVHARLKATDVKVVDIMHYLVCPFNLIATTLMFLMQLETAQG